MEINGVGFKDPAADGSTNAASSTLAGTFDTFLALLTTQLQNQDPLDPMKSEQFTQQLVQFAGVEQSINTNKKLEQLIELQTAGQLNSAVSYMGKTVEVISDEMMLNDGTVTVSYGLDRNAETTVITIVDLDGNAVRSFDGENTVGRHELTWDGLDADGSLMPDGVYGFSVVAIDRDEEAVGTVAASLGRVTGVEIVDGGLMLNIGEMGTPFDSLFAVREEEPSN